MRSSTIFPRQRDLREDGLRGGHIAAQFSIGSLKPNSFLECRHQRTRRRIRNVIMVPGAWSIKSRPPRPFVVSDESWVTSQSCSSRSTARLLEPWKQVAIEFRFGF